MKEKSLIKLGNIGKQDISRETIYTDHKIDLAL